MINAYFTSVGTTQWTVPSDWNNTNNYIAVIGGGGGLSCGGGGGFSSSNNVSLTPGQTVYIRVGAGAYSGSGGSSWINIANNNSQPTGTPSGILATGGHGSDTSYYNDGGGGFYGSVNFSGGRGLTYYGPAGGAGGPHGAGLDASTTYGGAGDAGYGGAGGYEYAGYSATAMGHNGTEWGGNYGSGGGGGYWTGGLYGGGGGDYGSGAQGMAIISYTPGPAIPPPPPPGPPSPPPPPPPGGGSVCDCLLPVFNPSDGNTASAKSAQYYWAYGTWADTFSGTAHYDSTYTKLLSLKGDDNTSKYDNQYDTPTKWTTVNEQENIYSDYPRVWKSRSNEWVDDNGQRSVWCRHRVLIANSLCLPDSEPSLGYATCTTNLLYMDEQTYGWRLSYTYNNGLFSPGDVVAQDVNGNTTVYGTVYQMDPNYIWINIPVGQFFPGSVYNTENHNINAWAVAVTSISEKYSSNVFIGQSRYISKSTVLATGQDAEDLQVLMYGYRPANTNFKVYAKVISKDDPGFYYDRIWTRMVESSDTSTSYSSFTNLNDFVDLQWNFPQSQILYGNISGCNCSSEYLYVTVPSTKSFTSGMFIYLTDPSTGAFNVRGIASVINTSMIQLLSLPSFSNTTNVNIGIISGLEDRTGAFMYDGYDGSSLAMRYVTNNDISFDSFHQFAVKLVPVSDNPCVVPRATDLRVLALQAD